MQKITLTYCLLLILFVADSAAQQPDPDSPRYKGAMLAKQLFSDGDISVDQFLRDHVAKSLIKAESERTTLANLKKLLAAVSDLDLVGIGPVAEYSARLDFEDAQGNSRVMTFVLEASAPHRFAQISIEGGPRLHNSGSAAGSQQTPLTWENLESRLELESKNGFEGAVLIVRDRKIVVDKGFGFANRKQEIANQPDTIFAIGSMPIDFTHASILQLAESGKLSLDDPITKFFDGVPTDKRTITVEHLRTGRSGLPDFHGLPTDANPDHSWIDRDEAIRRIMNQTLRFEPGKGRAHSHSAWGLLAAIVEITSGQSYQEYTRENLFKPAQMNSTGFFGEAFSDRSIAVGYGKKSNDKSNSPDNWGPTSWLVMGSGGQVSTTGDMYRWMRALHDGKLLKPESVQKYFGGNMGLAAAGDMFGFELNYTQGPESVFFLISNSISGSKDRARFDKLGRDLAKLVIPSRRFSLGIGMEVVDDGVTITRVVDDSAAEHDGLRVGDVLIEAGGKSMAPDPIQVLEPYLNTGKTIEFVVKRNGKQIKVSVTPKRNSP